MRTIGNIGDSIVIIECNDADTFYHQCQSVITGTVYSVSSTYVGIDPFCATDYVYKAILVKTSK